MKSRAKLVVALCALVTASAVATWHVTRDRVNGVGTFTDASGERYELEAAGVRHAVFAEPQTLPGGVNSASDELRSTRSADGRWLVFAVGARGANTELWVGECVGDDVRALRRVTELDTSADECAPCFAADALWFASDRPGGAGGLDLYRAAFDGGTFGPAERLPESWQSRADDTDPTPDPTTGAVVFVSDRDGTARAYEGRIEDDGKGSRMLTGLGAGVREPSFARDGRSLWFARERQGAFDIHRAERRADDFLDLGPVRALATAADERAPVVWDDFTLLFARSAPGTRGYDLARVRSLEILRVAALPWTWLEIVTIAALLVLALMAFLSDRWPALDTLYRCYLVSVLLHLLLALWLQHVYVEGGTPSDPDRGRKVRVKLAPSASSLTRTSRERAGDVSDLAPAGVEIAGPERVVLPSPADPTARPAPASLTANLSTTVDTERAAPRRIDLAPTETLDQHPLETLNDAEAITRAYTTPRVEMEIAASPLASDARRAPTPTPTRALFGAVVTPSDTTEPRVIDFAGAPLVLPEPRATRSETTPLSVAGDVPLLDREEPSALRGRETASSSAPGIETGLEDPVKPDMATHRQAPAQATFEPLTREETRPRAPSPTFEAPRVTLDSAPSERAELSPMPTEIARGEPLLDGETRGSIPPAQPERAPREDILADWVEPAARAAPAAAPKRAEWGSAPGEASAPALESLAAAPPREVPPPSPPVRGEWGREVPEVACRGLHGSQVLEPAKERALEDHGGSVETERAVERGLEYLASVQSPAGHFGNLATRDAKYGQIAIGKTGLALLAFLGAGHTPVSNTRFSAVSQRALEFLAAEVDPASGHIGDGDAYSHGIAAYAIAEAYALTKEARWREPLERAVRRIVAAQSRSSDPRLNGGWSYYYGDGRIFDRWSRAAITSWQVMALESARLSGITVDDQVFTAAAQFLEGCRDPEEDYVRYSHDPTRIGSDYPTLPASTPAALFALSILGRDIDSADFTPERRFVVERAPRGFRFTNERDFVQRGQGNAYFHYYGTLAMFRAGGGAWKTWNEALKRSLLPAQNADGSWTPIDVYARYARDDENDMSYTTALCVLSLEVYYRYYLPLFKVTVR